MSGFGLGGLAKLGAKGIFGAATSFLGGAKYWLIALAVSNIATGAIFYYKGSDHVLTKTINATTAQLVSARAEGAAAQSKQDADDQASTKADYEKRLAADAKRNAALEALLKNKPILIPHNAVCLVSKATMSLLNDPDLIGKDAQ